MTPARFALGLLQWLVVSGALLGLTGVAWRHLRVRAWPLDGLVFLFLFVFLTTATVLGVGLAGWLTPGPLLAASALGIALAALGAGRLVVGAEIRRGARAVAARIALAGRAERAAAGFLAAAVAVQLVRGGVHAWILPPYVWDAMAYHLPSVAEWTQQGRIAIFPIPARRALWPANHEVWQTWFVLFPRHDALVDLANVPYYLLAVGAVWSLARSLGLPPGPAAFAAVAYAYTPGVALQAATTNNDLPVAALFLFAMAVLLHLRAHPAPLGRTLALAWLALGLALGTKAYIVFIAPGLLVVAAWLGWEGRFRGAAAATARRGGLVVGLLLAVGVLLGTYWYLRNWILFDNPFYPTSFRLFGHVVFGPGGPRAQQGAFSADGLLANLWLLKTKVFDLSGPYDPDLNGMTGWGWFAFAGGYPAVAYGLVVSRPAVPVLALAFGLSLLSLLGWVNPDPYNMRFALWFPALFALAFPLAAARVRTPAVRWAWYGLAAGCLGLNLLGTLTVSRMTPADWRRLAATPVLERSAAWLQAETRRRIGPTYARALSVVPPGEVIGYSVEEPQVIIYPLYGADLSRRIRYVPLRADGAAATLMRRDGVRYLFVWRPRPEIAAKLGTGLADGTLRQVSEGLYVRTD